MVLPPLVDVKPVVLLTVIGTLAAVPAVTEKDPVLGAMVKVSVVAVTVRATVAVFDTAPDVPVTVTVEEPLAISGIVPIVNVVLVLEVVGVKLHVSPTAKPEQLNVTVPVKPVAGATVTVIGELVSPAATLMVPGSEESEKLGRVADQACARTKASTEPRPVT